MNTEDNLKKLMNQSQVRTSSQTDERILADAVDRIEKLIPQSSFGTGRNLWRIIMKSPITKLAAAAVIIIIVFFGIYRFGGSTPAIADVLEPFLTARTATFKVTITGQNVPFQEYDSMFMEPCRLRYAQPEGGIVIIDLEKGKGKFVTLLPQLKQAIVLEMTNLSEDPGTLNFFQEIRWRILKAQPLNDENVEFLGEQQVDGQKAIGYHIKKPGLDGTVWANSDTKMPVRVEVREEPMIITMSNIVFNVELDEALFSQEIPPDYSVTAYRKDMSEPTEEDFIESFKIWAEYMDGNFPPKMDRSALDEFRKRQKEKMKDEKITEPSKVIDGVVRLQQVIIDMVHGFPFVESLPADSDWHYVGKDVKFGDARTPIFWYRPKGSANYHVIYGDLSVKDVSPENLPK
jgi:outer membrane lipoprotein-sorting protein